MCLCVDLRKTQQAKRRNKTGFATRYKRVQVELTADGKVKIKSNIYSHIWKPGMMQCGRKKMPAIKDDQFIECAVHVYVEKRYKRAGFTYCKDEVWLEVECCKEDLIAANKGNEEAYMQVYLTKAEYDRVRDNYTRKLLKNVVANHDARYFAMHGCSYTEA